MPPNTGGGCFRIHGKTGTPDGSRTQERRAGRRIPIRPSWVPCLAWAMPGRSAVPSVVGVDSDADRRAEHRGRSPGARELVPAWPSVGRSGAVIWLGLCPGGTAAHSRRAACGAHLDRTAVVHMCCHTSHACLPHTVGRLEGMRKTWHISSLTPCGSRVNAGVSASSASPNRSSVAQP